MTRVNEKVGVFLSHYDGGGVTLWYCKEFRKYLLKYEINYYTAEGLRTTVKVLSYDADDYIQVSDIFEDAINIAGTPLLNRD